MSNASEPTPGLSAAQVVEFHERGYLHVERVFSPSDLEPIREELDAAIDRRARALHAEGVLASSFSDLDFDERLARISETTDAVFRALFSGVHRGPALFELLRHEKLLALVESLIGSEIMCHPAYRLRPKLPDLERAKRLTVVPWHQDAAYLDPTCDSEFMLTVWIAFNASTLDNGCLEVIPGGHRAGLLPHRNVRGRTYLDILPDALPGPGLPIEAQPGGVILMTNHTPHCSTSNRTQRIRWSLDARYHDVRVPSGYAKEAGFLARSRRDPGAVVDSFEQFDHIRSSHVPGPASRWQRWPILDLEEGP